MKLEKSRFNSEAALQPVAAQSVIGNNDFAALVPVISGQIGGRENNIVSAKVLHKTLGVGRDLSTWCNERIQEYGFVRGVDYFTNDDQGAAWLINEQYFPVSGKYKKRGRPEKGYYPT